MASNSSALPNPLTPLAFLPPDVARQEEVARAVIAAVVGAWLWDVFMSLSEEFRMVFAQRLRLSDVVYMLSRLFTFGFILSSLIFVVGPVDNCERLVLWLGWSCAIAMPLNSLLFFFRIKAVFHRSPGFIVFFGILWLCTLTTITAPFAVNHAISVGSPAICVETNIKSYATVGSVVIAAHDTLVYFAISLQLTMSHLPNTPYTFKDTLKIFFSGKGIGKISRSLLTTGQLYYFVTIGMNIIDIAILFSPAIPAVYKATFPIPNVALQNVMACRVHRQLKLGLISETSTPSSLHSSLFDGLSDQNTPKGQMTSIRFQCPNCRTTGVDHSRTYESTIASRWESDLAKRPELIETSEGIRQSDKSRHGVESVEMKDLGSV